METIASLKTLLRKPNGKNIAKEKSTIYFQLPLMDTSLGFVKASHTNVSYHLFKFGCTTKCFSEQIGQIVTWSGFLDIDVALLLKTMSKKYFCDIWLILSPLINPSLIWAIQVLLSSYIMVATSLLQVRPEFWRMCFVKFHNQIHSRLLICYILCMVRRNNNAISFNKPLRNCHTSTSEQITFLGSGS